MLQSNAMTAEAGKTRRQVRMDPDGTVIINDSVTGTRTVVEEKGAPRKSVDSGKQKKSEKLEFPEGTIDSLRPLLRQIFDDGFDDEAYWAKIVAETSMTEQDAVNKLRAAGKSHEEVARELVISDRQGHNNATWGRLNESQIEEKITDMAKVLLPYYQN